MYKHDLMSLNIVYPWYYSFIKIFKKSKYFITHNIFLLTCICDFIFLLHLILSVVNDLSVLNGFNASIAATTRPFHAMKTGGGELIKGRQL